MIYESVYLLYIDHRIFNVLPTKSGICGDYRRSTDRYLPIF